MGVQSKQILDEDEGYKLLALTLIKQSIADIVSGDRSRIGLGHNFLKSYTGKLILAYYDLDEEVYRIIEKKRNNKQYKALISK